MWSAICPFCFRMHDFRSQLVCPGTSFAVPEPYVADAADSPPLWLMTVGFKAHGKTCFIASLSQVLESMQLWSSGFFTPLDNFSIERMREIRRLAATGKVEAETPPGPPRPLFFEARDLPGIASRCLVVYDVPGEAFDKLDQVAEHAPAMRAVQTIWFFVCLRDLDRVHKERTLQELFAIYRAGMRRLRVTLQGRALIVVFTKFDQEISPESVRDYLRDDPMRRQLRGGPSTDAAQSGADWSSNLDAYRGEMQSISDQLEEFTRTKVRGGAGFLAMARSEGLKVVFTATSALGDDPVDGCLPEGARPSRVLDPYLWATMLQSSISVRRFRLVLDGLPGADASHPDVAALWHRLGVFAEVVTYSLGRTERVGVAGEPPPARPPKTDRSRLVGPLLECLAAEDLVLILTSGPLLDLGDFDRTDWPRRILIVTCGEAWNPGDPWRVLAAPEGEAGLDAIVERFVRLS